MTGSTRIMRLLAGLEAGVLGSLAMLFWFMFNSAWHGQSVWSVPNLAGSTFYRDSAFREGGGYTTLTGIAVYVFFSGVLGAVFGVTVRETLSGFRVAMLGLLWGLCWYYIAYGFVWQKLNPLVSIYSPVRSTLLAHLLLGAFLGRYPEILHSLRGSGES